MSDSNSRTVRLGFDTLDRLETIADDELPHDTSDLSYDQTLAAVLDVFEQVREERDVVVDAHDDSIEEHKRQLFNLRQRLDSLETDVERLEELEDGVGVQTSEGAFDDLSFSDDLGGSQL